MARKFTIELTEREIFILWFVACWFNHPFTSTLKAKLSVLAFEQPKRKVYEKRYGKIIEDRLIDVAGFIANRRLDR